MIASVVIVDSDPNTIYNFTFDVPLKVDTSITPANFPTIVDGVEIFPYAGGVDPSGTLSLNYHMTALTGVCSITQLQEDVGLMLANEELVNIFPQYDWSY